MSDVDVKETSKVTHAETCTDRESCACPRVVVGYRYEICFRWPSGNLFRERKQVPLPKTTMSKARAWAAERFRFILAEGEQKLAARKKEEEEQAPASVVPTFSAFGPRYVIEYLRANRRKPRTVEEYEGILDFHIYPRFGTKRLDQLSLPDVQKLKGDLEDLSPKTVNNVLSVLSTLLKYAVHAGEIASMPITITQLKVAEAEVEYYEPAVYERLVETAKKVDARSHIMVLLGGDAGLRRGEMVALEWPDVDVVHGYLHVKRSESKKLVSLPKGGRPRKIRMTNRLKDALQAIRHLRGARVFSRDPEYRWDQPHAGESVTDRTLQNWMERVQKRAGLEVTGNLHILRHTFCSRLAMLGLPPKAIKELAGHRHLSTTDRYMHLSPAVQDQAIAILEAGESVFGRLEEIGGNSMARPQAILKSPGASRT